MLEGGCGFYIKNSVSFVVRQEPSKKHLSSQSKYKAQRIEILHTNKENFVVAVVYKHPKRKDT